jgi:hypothetical protein
MAIETEAQQKSRIGLYISEAVCPASGGTLLTRQCIEPAHKQRKRKDTTDATLSTLAPASLPYGFASLISHHRIA